MKVVILEDAPAIAKSMKNYVEAFRSDVKVEKILDSVEDSINYFQVHGMPDLIFSDIELSDGLCFEIYENIKIKCPIIFTTSYNEYWQKAFKLNSIDYLLKPLTKAKVFESMDKYMKVKDFFSFGGDNDKLNALIQSIGHSTKTSQYKERFLLKKGDKYNLVNIKDIKYVFSSDKLSTIVDKDDTNYYSYDSLSKIDEELNPDLFFRINRKYIINIDYIDKVKPFFKGKLVLILKDSDLEVVVSQSKANSFRKWLSF